MEVRGGTCRDDHTKVEEGRFPQKLVKTVGRDSSVGIATRYELDGKGIESRWRRIFHIRPDRAWGPPNLLYSKYRICFPEVKRPGRGVNHPPPRSAEVIPLTPSGPSWPVLGQTLPLPLPGTDEVRIEDIRLDWDSIWTSGVD
jgi:hypothetical protein